MADVAIPGCGSVTLESSGSLTTIMYASPGDELWISHYRGFVFGQQLGPAKIHIDTPYPGAQSYFATPLNAPHQTSVVDVYWSANDVDSQGRATVLVHPTSTAQGNPEPNGVITEAYAVFEDVVMTAALQTPLHVTSWIATPPARHFALQFPKVATGWGATVSSAKNGHVFYPIQMFLQPPAIAPTFDVQVPDVGTSVSVGLAIVGDPVPGNGSRVRTMRLSLPTPLPQSVNLDLTNELLPEVLATSATIDPTRTTVNWTLDSTADTSDAVVIRVHPDQGRAWRIMGPPGITEIKVPELPPDLLRTFNNAPVSGVMLFEASDLVGYAATRLVPADAFGIRRYPDGVRVRWSYSGYSAQ